MPWRRALEGRVARAADAIIAVSSETHEQVRRRHPAIEMTPCAAIPLGGEATDFDGLWSRARANPYFDPADGHVHVCCVGTLAPLGLETLRAVLDAVGLLRDRRPDTYRCLRLHFFGTSSQTAGTTPPRVLPIARELAVADRVTEVASRVDYLDALTIQTQAGVLLAMGSSEPHYTASRLYPALLARRPLLAVYHEESSGVEFLRRVARPPTVRLVTYGDVERAGHCVEAIYTELSALIDRPVYDPLAVDMCAVDDLSARAMAGKLAGVLDRRARSAMSRPSG